MKQIAVVFRVFLLATVLVSLAACSGGTFVDPGHKAAGSSGGDDYGDYGDYGDYDDDDNDSGGRRSYKPITLSGNASYAQAVAKLDEIISYCNAHPGRINDLLKAGAQEMKTTIRTFQSSWSARGPEMANQINIAFIDMLE